MTCQRMPITRNQKVKLMAIPNNWEKILLGGGGGEEIMEGRRGQMHNYIGREGREGDTEGGIHVTHFHPELHTIIAKSEISTTHIDPHNTMGTTTVSVVLF